MYSVTVFVGYPEKPENAENLDDPKKPKELENLDKSDYCDNPSISDFKDPYEVQIYEFAAVCDLDSVDVSKPSEKFKADNVIYPRANVEKEELYTGNIWLYETECNRMGWHFVALNEGLLYGHRGITQRAVDVYRRLLRETDVTDTTPCL